MKKIFLCFTLIMLVIISNTLPAIACWEATGPFEIFSEDESRVFVFIPSESSGNAYAAVYDIINTERYTERHLLYIVEDLSSFAYENNFYFSSDMMHFARTFVPPGLPVFEIFSYGIRTRTVFRSDIIEDYDSVETRTCPETGQVYMLMISLGPNYIVNWRIEDFSPQEATLTISTDEGNTFLFDIATAPFITEDDLTDTSSDYLTTISYDDLADEHSDDSADDPAPTPASFLTVIGIITGAIVVIFLLWAGIFFLVKRKKS